MLKMCTLRKTEVLLAEEDGGLSVITINSNDVRRIEDGRNKGQGEGLSQMAKPSHSCTLK
jgi:hypothetical protein